MPKVQKTKSEEEIQVSPEPVRMTRAVARRLGSVERDTPGTPKRSNSVMSLDTIIEDTPGGTRSTRAAKKTPPLETIDEKGNPTENRIGTPRRSRRTSVIADSPMPQSFTAYRRPASDQESNSTTTTPNPGQPRITRQRAASNLTQQNVESLNGRSVSFSKSPESDQERVQFPKTPRAAAKTAKEADTSSENEGQTAQVSETQNSPNGEKVVEVEAGNEVEEIVDGAEKVEKTAEDKTEEKVPEDSGVTDDAKTEFSTSWTQSVTGHKDSEGPIDAFGEKERKEEKEKRQEVLKEAEQPIKHIYKLVKIDSEDDYAEEDDEEEVKTGDFIDDEAIEVDDEEESMDEEERKYLNDHEIPVDGISLGSEDSEDDREVDDDDEEDSQDDFIQSSGDEAEESAEDDSLDELEAKCETVKKGRKRIREIEDSDEEIERYKDTTLVRFQGTVLSNLTEEDKRVIDAEFDQDVSMTSLSPSEKSKTPQKSPQRESVPRNLEKDLRETPVKEALEEKESPESPKPSSDSDSQSEEEKEGKKESESDGQWEDLEGEEEEEATSQGKSFSAITARCQEFLQKKREAAGVLRKINQEKREKKRAAKERKEELKRKAEEKRADLERLKAELKEKKQREKEAQQQVKGEEEHPVVTAQEENPRQSAKTDSKAKAKAVEMIPEATKESTKKKKRVKRQDAVNEDTEESIVQKSKKKKKERQQESQQEEEEMSMKRKKKKTVPAEDLPSKDPKRLPLSLLNQLAATERTPKIKDRSKRTAEENPEHTGMKKRRKIAPESPKQINTTSGMFNVEPLVAKDNIFSVRDAKLIRKAQVTKQFKREKRLKQFKPAHQVQEPSAVFPRSTTSWTATGVFQITDIQPQVRVVETGVRGGAMEFVVTSLEPKKGMSKKTLSTSALEKPAKSFKEAKLYGSGTVRESSKDLMHRNVKKKFLSK
ncbi:glutamic acid-rich protein-like isoform X2 [Phlebotomus argentipes]|uniref:glutamic acid-rich protein-like isoform X2 n=1 Tax=Phlebotomus argentipes TaxID=94469 RepID=UPI002892E766|nr:glutamic acid-rich protein-like isoform X2 [Phlebotomus argentipes]